MPKERRHMETRAETSPELLEEVYAIVHVLRLLFQVQETEEIRTAYYSMSRLCQMIKAKIVQVYNELYDAQMLCDAQTLEGE